jgi:hypothetical protein
LDGATGECPTGAQRGPRCLGAATGDARRWPLARAEVKAGLAVAGPGVPLFASGGPSEALARSAWLQARAAKQASSPGRRDRCNAAQAAISRGRVRHLRPANSGHEIRARLRYRVWCNWTRPRRLRRLVGPSAASHHRIYRRRPAAANSRRTRGRAGGQMKFAFGVSASFSQSPGLYERRRRVAHPRLPADRPSRKLARPGIRAAVPASPREQVRKSGVAGVPVFAPIVSLAVPARPTQLGSR